MIHPNDYTSFEHEWQPGDAMASGGMRVWREEEYKRAVRSRFGDENTRDLRDGARDMGIPRYSKMTRAQLLDAIAQWRWEHLPTGLRADHPDAGRRQY